MNIHTDLLLTFLKRIPLSEIQHECWRTEREVFGPRSARGAGGTAGNIDLII